MFSKITRVSMICALLFQSSCGGGGGESEGIFEGTWRGEQLNGGANCSDGFFIGVGLGIKIGDIELRISGGKQEGDLVTIQYDDCILEGVASGTKVEARPVSGCYPALSLITFEVQPDGSADYSLGYNPSLVPEEDRGANGVGCVSQSYGTVTR